MASSTVIQPNALQPPIPVYIPTPKHILEARKASSTTTTTAAATTTTTTIKERSDGSARKKPKLEYVPKAISNNSGPVPTYIPSSVRNTSIDEYEPVNTANDETVIRTNIEADSNGDDISGLLTELLSDEVTNNQIYTDGMTNESADSKDSKEKSKENSHKSSSSRHRHHSSSHKSSRSEKSHPDRKSSTSSSRSSSSTMHKSSHHSSSSSSSRKSKHSDKEKDISSKEKDKHSTKSSKESKHRSSEHRSKSSSSSSSSRRHSSSSHSDKKTHSSNNNSSSLKEDCINESMVYESESDEDDVEAQCRMIFEEFDPSTIEIKPDDMPHDVSSPDQESNGKMEDAAKKKRIAHENVNRQVRSSESFVKKANHVQNAMQVCFFFHC